MNLQNHLFLIISDIDECHFRETNPCSHQCTNHYRGYQCSCQRGFNLLGNRCIGIVYYNLIYIILQKPGSSLDQNHRAEKKIT